MSVREPEAIDDLTSDYLSWIAAKILGDPSVEVAGFTVTPDPFEFPRFGEKQFYDIAFEYRGRGGYSARSQIRFAGLCQSRTAEFDQSQRLQSHPDCQRPFDVGGGAHGQPF